MSIVFGGSADVTFDSLNKVSITGSGELLFTGSASVTFFASGGVLENQKWVTDDPELIGDFLWSRVKDQKNPIATKELGPVEIGSLVEGLDSKEYICTYSTTTGEVFLNDVAQFTQLGIIKLDFTFDVFGYPVFTFAFQDGTINIRHFDRDSLSYVSFIVETGASQPFIVSAEKRLLWSYKNNKIYLLYFKNKEILSRSFQEQLYQVPRKTFLTATEGGNFILQGLGVTSEHKLKLLARYQYA